VIARLTGKVLEREEKSLIVDVNGVGYRVAALSSLRDRARKGLDVNLIIHHHVGDDSEDLYGFETKRDLKFFELLLTVPSVGPRTAMGILEVAPPPVLSQAVAEDDIAVLTKVSGVGRKTAERILVELKEKIRLPEVVGAAGGVQREAVEALISLGYSVTQARQVVQKLPKEVETVEEAVKVALQKQG